MTEYTRRRKQLAIVSIVLVLALAGLATWFVCRWLTSFSQDGFRDYIRSFGGFGPVVLLALQFLQVFVALIPGELLETAAGYAFVDLYTPLYDISTREVYAGYTVDGGHFTPKGYEVLTAQITPVLDSLLHP